MAKPRSRRAPSAGAGLFDAFEPPEPPGSQGAEAPRSEPASAEASAPTPPLLTGSYARVALNKPLRCEFSYAVPPELADELAPGVRVAVPFGRRREVGVVVALTDDPGVDPGRLKAVAKRLDPEPVVDAELLELTRWIAEHYACSWGEALAAILPATLKRERGARHVLRVAPIEGVGPEELEALEARSPKQHRLLRTLLSIGGPVDLRELCRKLNLSDAPARTLARKGLLQLERVRAEPNDPFQEAREDRPRHARLTDDQERAVAALTASVEAREHATFLLRGVTGSGKTEVYLRVIEEALARGRGAIVLVPEIALTPQTVGWFRSRFGQIAVLHSRMTDAQRFAMWRQVQRGEARVVVGARSAIFAPLSDLGVVVVDEEHEPSFKQSNTPRYHAREVAVRRARAAGAVCILGSATPSLESWRRAHEGRYRLLELPTRVSGKPLPPVEIVDMRRQGKGGLFSLRLRELLKGTLERGEQAILFQNRRGFAPVLWCRDCEKALSCEQCDTGLTLHRHIRRLVCHLCCEEQVVPEKCPSCGSQGLRLVGAGSERVEAELKKLFPEVRVRRMDSDTMHRREDYEDTLEAFGQGEFDVLVGTQMIAKGLDFPRVTLVGIVAADASLHLPDFRASERTFQLIAQVSGRAGRGELDGRIVVQTRTPEHPAIQAAARHDFAGFAKEEDELRAELGYPPHGDLLRVIVEDADEARVKESVQELAEALRAGEAPEGVTILGPAPAPLAVIRGQHRHHLLVKSQNGLKSLSAAREELLELAHKKSRPRVTLDVDPMSVL